LKRREQKPERDEDKCTQNANEGQKQGRHPALATNLARIAVAEPAHENEPARKGGCDTVDRRDATPARAALELN
jgi:hypothetical protein